MFAGVWVSLLVILVVILLFFICFFFFFFCCCCCCFCDKQLFRFNILDNLCLLVRVCIPMTNASQMLFQMLLFVGTAVVFAICFMFWS
eukprot:NODE_8967_length_336_cov_26.313589_g7206_i0.p1 GENE.NODE_8967_length_336_cov_26.313589_g7206_i0~~NODE_8967_length_336_cov_26.313589_g7206_i0.p1  ORF type:complete len:88 (-),score=11.71 NODE_8967_length_336_cov_26.313589_g7206_i0:1-264(-)